MRIGALKLGGIGDICDFAVIINGIRRRFPYAAIIAIANTGDTILKYYADGVIIDKKTDWYQLASLHKWKFDLFYDLRPHAGLVFRGDYFREAATIVCNRKGHQFYDIDIDLTSEHLHQFNHYNSWATNRLQDLHKSVVELNCEAVGVRSNYDEARLPVSKFSDGNFITINCGAMGSERGIRQTKQWNGWQEVCDGLVERGERVVQLGIRWEKKLKRVEHVWQRPLPEVMRYLASSKLHLGNENGIVRLRRLVTNKPSVVVFGPTHPIMYGFKNNINIWSNICRPCFWYTGEWMWKCAMGWDNICMKSITPEMVLERCGDVLS